MLATNLYNSRISGNIYIFRFFHQGTGKRIIEKIKINLFAFCQSSYLHPTLIEDQNDLDKFALEIHNICLLDRIELSLLWRVSYCSRS